jgi:hypothetical protein
MTIINYLLTMGMCNAATRILCQGTHNLQNVTSFLCSFCNASVCCSALCNLFSWAAFLQKSNYCWIVLLIYLLLFLYLWGCVSFSWFPNMSTYSSESAIDPCLYKNQIFSACVISLLSCL